MAKIAFNRLKNPRAHNLGNAEPPIMKQASMEDFQFGRFEIRTYHWNKKNEKAKVLLIHGWEGQAANFSALIEKLVEEGYRVSAFDGPSHGKSSKGKTSLFEFTELVGLLIREFEANILISHSFGSVAAAYALYNNPDLTIDKFVLVTAPDKFMDRIDYVSEQLGLTVGVKDKLILLLEQETGLDLGTMNVSDFVGRINVKQSLIVHDVNDKVVSIDQSRNVHQKWKRSALEEVKGTGHFRILKSDKVQDKIIQFIRS